MNRSPSLGVVDLLAWAATILAAISAASGLFIGGLYRDVPFWVEQARGIDLATLFLAAPILVIALLAARRGSSMAQLAIFGGLLYLIYNYLIYTTSIAMNRLAILYIATFGLSTWSLALMLLRVDLSAKGSEVLQRLPRRVTSVVLVAVAVLFALLWLSQIASFTGSGRLPADLKRANLPANPVYALDLALFLPLALVAGIGLLQRRLTAAAFALPMLIWVFLTSAGIVGGFIFEGRAGETVALPVLVVVSGVAIVAALLSLAAIVRQSRG
jgi:hypothetical protein